MTAFRLFASIGLTLEVKSVQLKALASSHNRKPRLYAAKTELYCKRASGIGTKCAQGCWKAAVESEVEFVIQGYDAVTASMYDEGL